MSYTLSVIEAGLPEEEVLLYEESTLTLLYDLYWLDLERMSTHLVKSFKSVSAPVEAFTLANEHWANAYVKMPASRRKDEPPPHTYRLAELDVSQGPTSESGRVFSLWR